MLLAPRAALLESTILLLEATSRGRHTIIVAATSFESDTLLNLILWISFAASYVYAAVAGQRGPLHRAAAQDLKSN